MKTIPTKFKEKIPRGFSYPIGAELLSSALSETPQIDLFILRFSYQDEYWASSYATKIKEKSQIRIIEVTYKNHRPHHSASNDMIESGYYGPKWEIRVNSLPSEYAAIAKEQLISRVLPDLSALLKQAIKNSSLESQHWVVLFNPKLKEAILQC
jgi:hypothetical protein